MNNSLTFDPSLTSPNPLRNMAAENSYPNEKLALGDGPILEDNSSKDIEKAVTDGNLHPNETTSIQIGDVQEDILQLQDIDPALNAKMHIVNNVRSLLSLRSILLDVAILEERTDIWICEQAIDEIGWTNYHWKLFILNGFGYLSPHSLPMDLANTSLY